MRAWRELTDGVRAGTARWEGHWSSSETHAPLARQLTFPALPSAWAGEHGWQVRMVLAWQRLVRQDVVRLKRRRSPQWRATAKERVDSMVDLGWGNSAHTSSAEVYNWRAELEEQARGHDMGSGASAVLVRRRLAANEAASSSPPDTPDTPVTDASRKRPRTAAETGAPSAVGVGQSIVVATPDPGQDGGDGEGADRGDGESSTSALDESDVVGGMEAVRSAAHRAAAGTLGQGGVRRRAMDGLLVFNPLSRARVERILGVWWRPPAPFGDG